MSGTVDTSALHTKPEQFEMETASFLASMGKDIVFICPTSIPNIHSPDILMDGIEWEIKCPTGKSKRTIENNITKAAKQSHNIIIDLRHINLPENICISKIKNEYQSRKSIKKILIITKSQDLIEYTK